MFNPITDIATEEDIKWLEEHYDCFVCLRQKKGAKDIEVTSVGGVYKTLRIVGAQLRQYAQISGEDRDMVMEKAIHALADTLFNEKHKSVINARTHKEG